MSRCGAAGGCVAVSVPDQPDFTVLPAGGDGPTGGARAGGRVRQHALCPDVVPAANQKRRPCMEGRSPPGERGLFGPENWPICGMFGESGPLQTANQPSLTRIARAVGTMHASVEFSVLGPVRLHKQGVEAGGDAPGGGNHRAGLVVVVADHQTTAALVGLGSQLGFVLMASGTGVPVPPAHCGGALYPRPSHLQPGVCRRSGTRSRVR